MKQVIRILLLTLSYGAAIRQTDAQEYIQGSSRSHSLADISVCLADEWSSLGNQAGITQITHPGAGVSGSRIFLLEEMGQASAIINLPIENNAFALSFYRFGYNKYNENKLGLAYAKTIIPGFAAGFQFNYWYMHLPENEQNPSCFFIEGGLQYHISEKTIVGCHFFNPLQTGIKCTSTKFKIPSIIRLGATYQPIDEVLAACELEKDLQHDLHPKFGIEWHPCSPLYIRAGLAIRPNKWTLGLGYRYRNIQTDFSWQYHVYLGSTPSVSVYYSLFRQD